MGIGMGMGMGSGMGIHKSPEWAASDRRQHQNVSSHCHCMPRIHDTLFIYSNNNNAMQTLIVIDCQPKAAHAHSPRPDSILEGMGYGQGETYALLGHF